MGNECKPMGVSFQCMTKFTTNKKKKKERKKLKKIKKKKQEFRMIIVNMITTLKTKWRQCKNQLTKI